jgi:CRP-like cAMP-binding protein
MNTITLIDFLISNLHIEEEKINAIIKQCKVRAVKKDEFLLQQGEFCKLAFFVEKGLLRQFSLDENGKEHIIYFASESWFVTDRESTYFNLPSKYYIQALEDSQVVLIDEEFTTLLSQKFPSYIDFNNKLLHNHIRHLQSRVTQLLSATAEQRYMNFIALYPDLTFRIPQWMIASYLGITPESLSRVRKELARRNFKPLV